MTELKIAEFERVERRAIELITGVKDPLLLRLRHDIRGALELGPIRWVNAFLQESGLSKEYAPDEVAFAVEEHDKSLAGLVRQKLNMHICMNIWNLQDNLRISTGATCANHVAKMRRLIGLWWGETNAFEEDRKRPAQMRPFDEVVRSCGLDPITMVGSWGLCHAELSVAMRENMRRLLELEEEQPGAAATLHREFSISQFARYSTRFLVTQYKRRSRKEPYIVSANASRDIIISKRANYSGTSLESAPLYDQLLDSARRVGRGVRAIECPTVTDGISQLRKMHNRYGHRHRIGGFVIGAHSNGEYLNIKLDKDSSEELSIHRLLQLPSEALAEARQWFEELCPFLFDACFTGQLDDESFARVTSEKFRTDATGPVGISEMRELDVRKHPLDDRVELHGAYVNGPNAVRAVTYRQGNFQSMR